MVAPLNVDLVVIHQRIQYPVRTRPPVVNIADHMQSGDGQTLDQFSQMYDVVLGPACVDDRLKQALIVIGFVFDLGLLVKQFLDQRRHMWRQELPDRFAAILGSQQLAKLDQPDQGQPAPLGRVRHRLQHQRRFFLRVVNQRSQIALLTLGQRIGEHFLDLAPDRTCAVANHMLKRLVFAVDIGQKMLGPFQ